MSAQDASSSDEVGPQNQTAPDRSPPPGGADLGDLLLEQESMRSVLQKVAERAVELVPGAEEGSVTLVERGSTAAQTFDDDAARSTAAAIAGRAAVAIADMHSLDRTRRTVSDLETAMASRAAIEQAKGILMARLGLDAEAAFDLLARESQHRNRKLRDVAGDLVASVSRPDSGGADRRPRS